MFILDVSVEVLIHLQNVSSMLGMLASYIEQDNCPHYFIPGNNLLRSTAHKRALINAIYSINSNMLEKLHNSTIMKAQIDCPWPDFKSLSYKSIVCRDVLDTLNGRIQSSVNDQVFKQGRIDYGIGFKSNRTTLLDLILNFKIHPIDPELIEYYKNSYNIQLKHDRTVNVMQKHIDQYIGCVYLTKYCMLKRDKTKLSNSLLTNAERLLKHTVDIDPCTGYIKLACLYLIAEDSTKAIQTVNNAQHNFDRCQTVENLVTEKMEDSMDMNVIFLKWEEGRVIVDTVVYWQEYNIVPDVLQFELIQESTQQVIDVPLIMSRGKMVGLDCHLKWAPLPIIHLIKFVSSQKSGCSARTLEKIVKKMKKSAKSVPSGDKFTIFNIAAWCYVKIQKYRSAKRMLQKAISEGSQGECMKRSSFSHHFLAYILCQCLTDRHGLHSY